VTRCPSSAWPDPRAGTVIESVALTTGPVPVSVGEPAFAAADSESRSSMPYFNGTSSSDPLVLPVRSDQVLARFPLTLLIAGSRDFTVSSLFHAQAALTNVGVYAELHVWDGMWHAFFFDPDLPESQQVYRVVMKFFDRQLGAHPAK